jgi:hypothetical protein
VVAEALPYNRPMGWFPLDHRRHLVLRRSDDDLQKGDDGLDDDLQGRTLVRRERIRWVRKLPGRVLGARARRHDPEAGR